MNWCVTWNTTQQPFHCGVLRLHFIDPRVLMKKKPCEFPPLPYSLINPPTSVLTHSSRPRKRSQSPRSSMLRTPGQVQFRNLREVRLGESVVRPCRVSYLSRTSSEIYCCFMVICYREFDFSMSQCATSLGPTRIGESNFCTRQSQNGKNENSTPTTPIANDSNTTTNQATNQGFTDNTTRYNWYTSK